MQDLQDLVSELQEKLREAQAETDNTRQSAVDLQKKLEMTEMLLLQVMWAQFGGGGSCSPH